MSPQSSLSFLMTLGFLWVATSLGCAGKTASPPPSATIVSVEGASTTYHTRDWNGKAVTVRGPLSRPPTSRARMSRGACGRP
jgi:hypothetical protein